MSNKLGHCRVSLTRPAFNLQAALDIPAAGITGIYGPSGSGKTTLLRCIAGLEAEARGDIQIKDQSWQNSDNILPAHQRPAGYVFQDARLFPHLTVTQNLRYGLRRNDAQTAAAGFDQIVMLLGIQYLLTRKPANLSGGEAQRVAIARALLRAPRLLLLDEPLANLDRARKQDILPFLEKLHTTLTIPMLYVSHSLEEITHLCDHLAIMEKGRVLAQGPLADVLTRLDLPLAQGRGASAILNGQLAGFDPASQLSTVDCDGVPLRIPGRINQPGTPVRLRVLASDVSLCLQAPRQTTILNTPQVRIMEIASHANNHATLQLQLGRQTLLAHITRQSLLELKLQPGLDVFAQIKSLAIQKSTPTS